MPVFYRKLGFCLNPESTCPTNHSNLYHFIQILLHYVASNNDIYELLHDLLIAVLTLAQALRFWLTWSLRVLSNTLQFISFYANIVLLCGKYQWYQVKNGTMLTSTPGFDITCHIIRLFSIYRFWRKNVRLNGKVFI